MKKEKLVSFHVDIDSPRRLLAYWGFTRVQYTMKDLDHFYQAGLERLLELFNRCNIQATFFCVGDELENSSGARRMIKEAFSSGHEIANHTYSHPLGLTKLGQAAIGAEIERCSKIIKDITGSRPAGFRSPGYDIDSKIINILKQLEFRYDSSAFWSVFSIFFRLYHKYFCQGKNIYSGFSESSFSLPSSPYYPSAQNWQSPVSSGEIVEVPLARTQILQFPFYGNFHLMTPGIYRDLSINLMNRDYFVYLFHLIEFVDFDDNIPRDLHCHPNIGTKVNEKLAIIEGIIKRITGRYRNIRTDKFIEGWRNKAA